MVVVVEILGAALVLTEIAEKAIKVKDLWQSLKGASAEVDDLIEDLETIQGVCSEMVIQQDGLSPGSSNNSVMSCLRKCQAHIEVVLREAESARAKFKKSRSLASIKFELDRNKFSTFRNRLERAKSSLLAAQNQYIIETLHRHNSTFSDYIHRLQSPKQPLEDLEKQSNDHEQRPLTIRHSQQWYTLPQYRYGQGEAWSVRIRSPAWMLKTVLELQISGAGILNWSSNCRALNVVGESSPLMTAAKEGNVSKLQELFSNRTASPFDVDKEGRSALHHAASQRQLEVCRLLLEQGADANAQSFTGYTPLMHANVAFRGWIKFDSSRKEQMQDIIRLLIEHPTNNQAPFVPNDGPLFISDMGYSGSPEGLQIIQQKAVLYYAKFSLEDRFKWAMSLETWHSRGATSDLLETAMGGDMINPAAYRKRNSDNETLVFFIAQFLGIEHAKGRTVNLPGWRRLLKDAVEAGTDLHAVSTSTRLPRYDPFGAFIARYKKSGRHLRQQKYSLSPALRLWVTELQLAGVDLLQYGEKLRSMLRHGMLSCEWDIFMGEPTKRRSRPWVSDQELPLRIIGFSIGPEPDDWRAWTTDPIDELVGDFWYGIDNPWEFMPGAWPRNRGHHKKVRISPDKAIGRRREAVLG